MLYTLGAFPISVVSVSELHLKNGTSLCIGELFISVAVSVQGVVSSLLGSCLGFTSTGSFFLASLGSMAPKRRVAKSPAQAVVVTPVKQVDKDATLVEKEDAMSNPAAKAQSKAKSLAASVQKALTDNFLRKGWSAESLDLLIRNGKSIRGHVTYAKERQAESKEVIGKFFYQDLKIMFADAVPERALMKVDDASEPKDPRIVAAVLAITCQKMDTRLIDSIFATDYKPINQHTAKGLFAAFLEVPSSTEKGSMVLAKALSYISRNKLHEAYPALWTAVKSHMDAAMAKVYAASKCAGVKQALWLEKHEAHLGLVSNVAALKKCVANKTAWQDVQSELELACQSKVGVRMFGDKLASLGNRLISSKLNQIISGLDDKPITLENYTAVINAIDGLGQEMGKDLEATGGEEKIMFSYRGFQCSTKVKSFKEEAMVKIHAKIKGRAVACKALDPLWCEAELIPPVNGQDDAQNVVDASLVRDAAFARKAAMQMLTETSSAEIQKTLATRHAILTSLDRWWQVDRDFWLSVVGECGERRMEALILELMPTATKNVPMAELHDKLVALKQSPLHQFVGVGCQQVLANVVKVVAALKHSRCPEWPITNTEFMAAVKLGLANACRISHAGSSGAAARPDDVGKDAIKRQIEICHAKVTAGTSLRFQDIMMFRVYSWLLTDDQAKITDKWLSELLGGIAVIASGAVGKKKQLGQEAKAGGRAGKCKEAEGHGSLRLSQVAACQCHTAGLLPPSRSCFAG